MTRLGGMVSDFATSKVQKNWEESNPSLVFPLRDRTQEPGGWARHDNLRKMIFALHRRAERMGIDPALICCNHCGEWDEDVLEVDHIDGNRGNDSPTNLQFLCSNCHTRKTRKVRPIKSLADYGIEYAIGRLGLDDARKLFEAKYEETKEMLRTARRL